MDKLVNGPRSVVGTAIKCVTSMLVGAHPHTGHKLFRYFLELSSGTIIELASGDIQFCTQLPPNCELATPQIVDGPDKIDGEKIVAVVRRKDKVPGLPRRGVADFDPRQVALILSSERALRALIRDGGGTTLLIESLKGLTWHAGESWRDRWTDEVVVVSPTLNPLI